jgi:hypothetical protein
MSEIKGVGRRRFVGLCAAALCTLPATTTAKGQARSFSLVGVIQLPAPSERPEQFVLTGDLVVLDCRQQCETATWQKGGRMEVRIRFRPGQFFRVWTPDRHGAAVREPESMFAVIRDAAEHGHRVRLDLIDPTIHFGALGNMKGLEASLDGITDFHLN